MIHWLHKKFLPLILTLIFSVVGFGAFVNVASADIISDLSYILPLDAKYLPGSGRVAEIPSPPTLTASQAQTILVNIKNDGLVQSSFRRILNAVIALDIAQSNYDKNILGCPPDPNNLTGACPEAEPLRLAKDDLATAVAEIESALALARDRQDLTIQSFQAQNAVTEALNTGTKRITDTAQERQTSLSEQGQADTAGTAPVEFTPEYINAARQAQKNASAWNTDDTIALKMQQDCSVLKGVLMPCFAEAVYKIIYKPTAYALMGAGYIFDEILTLSIEGAMVAPPFIDSTWKVVRDFSNMLFIFILLYTGVQTILGFKGWEKTVRNVIIIALLINFSLFFTKVVIDAGNVLAVGVKSAISTTSVSEGLAASFQPQQFLSAATKGPDTSGGDAIIVFLVAAVVSGFAAYIFFKAALMFMGRLIAFWGLMIISPFAFISIAMPKGNIFNDWLDMLLKQSFVAPIFLFFVYIIMKVISGGTGILSGLPKTGDWFKDLLGPVIVATLLIIALKQALKIATDMSGKVGGFVAGMAGQAMGVAGGAAFGVATGGAAMLARQTIGRGGAALGEGLGNKLVSSDNALGRWAGRQSLAFADKAKTSSFDVRQADGLIGKNINKGLNKGLGAFGVDTKKGMGAMGPKSGKGGYAEGDRQRSQAKTDREHDGAERVEMSEAAKEKVTATTANVSAKKKAESDLEKEVDTLRKSGRYEPRLADLSKVLEVAKKERAEAEKAAAEASKEMTEAEASVESENLRRREQYAKDTIITSPSTWLSSKKSRTERAQRIRGGRSAEERAKAKERATGAGKKKEDKAKNLKSLAEKKKKAEEEGNTAVVEHYEKEIKKAEEGD